MCYVKKSFKSDKKDTKKRELLPKDLNGQATCEEVNKENKTPWSSLSRAAEEGREPARGTARAHALNCRLSTSFQQQQCPGCGETQALMVRGNRSPFRTQVGNFYILVAVIWLSGIYSNI